MNYLKKLALIDNLIENSLIVLQNNQIILENLKLSFNPNQALIRNQFHRQNLNTTLIGIQNLDPILIWVA